MNKQWRWDEVGVGLFFVAILMWFVCMVFGLFRLMSSPIYDPDLQKIQRQRNAMRLYEEASK